MMKTAAVKSYQLSTCIKSRSMQALTDPEKIARARAVAERGWSDLRAYADMASSAGGGDMSITLKGATS
jgi:hypothetical protein